MKQSCNSSLSLIAAGLILGLAGASLPIQAQTLKKPALDALIASSAPTPPESFKAFAQQAARAEPGVAPAVLRYTRGQTLSVHGWCYGLKDGLVKNLGVTMSSPQQVVPVYTEAIKRYPRQPLNPAA